MIHIALRLLLGHDEEVIGDVIVVCQYHMCCCWPFNMQETVAFLTLHFCSIVLGVSHLLLPQCTEYTAEDLFMPLKLIKVFTLVVIVTVPWFC
jgi:hypothetical protein